MTNLPELISRLRSAVHEESVLISPRTSKLIEEVKYAIGVLEGEAGLPAGEWQPIETAPKSYSQIVVWQPKSFNTYEGDTVMASSPAGPYTAHWDEIDGAWCLSGGTWLGPFLEPTHWMPLPLAPGRAPTNGNQQ